MEAEAGFEAGPNRSSVTTSRRSEGKQREIMDVVKEVSKSQQWRRSRLVNSLFLDVVPW